MDLSTDRQFKLSFCPSVDWCKWPKFSNYHTTKLVTLNCGSNKLSHDHIYLTFHFLIIEGLNT